MKLPTERFRDETLAPAFDRALAGDRAALIDKVRRASGLPGHRVNDGLVRAFAAECARRGAVADPLLAFLLSVHADAAPYGHVDEILPILGAAGTGARAAADPIARGGLLEELEEASCDERSRVRDEVSHALAVVGTVVGAQFVSVMRHWIDHEQPYLGRAAIAALGDTELLAVLGAEGASALLDAAFFRVSREHRAGRRHDAYRKLVRALEQTPVAVVARHPSACSVLERHAADEDEDVRGVIATILPAIKKGRAGDRAEAIAAALARTEKPSRDPRWDRLPGKRGRGKK